MKPSSDDLRANGWQEKSLRGFAGLIGPLWARKEGDSWAYGLLVTNDHLNPAGVAHGGVLMALADHAVSAIAWQALERRACITVQMAAYFLSAVRIGQFIEARGRVVSATCSLVFMEGQLSVEGRDVLSASAVLKRDPRADAGGAQ